MSECRLCQESEVDCLIDFGLQPVVRHLLGSPDETYPKFPFEVGACPRCGLIQILNPIPSEHLYGNYHFSGWKHQPHVQRFIEVAQSLTGIDSESELLEIGCNDGSFIRSLNNAGFKKCVGIEPATDAFAVAKENGFKVYNEYFPSADSEITSREGFFDTVICRQVLEHIVDLNSFLSGIYRCLKDQGTLVLEVPDASWHIDYVDYALWEEHVNYFTKETVKALLMKNGFRMLHHETTMFSGKALILVAIKDQVTNLYFDENSLGGVYAWASNWTQFKRRAQEFFHAWDSVVIYGCGNRSSTFVNLCELDNVKVFIDDQEEKQGLFLPGSGTEIREWHDCVKEMPILFGVNTENESKIIQRRELSKEFCFSILPPSRYLPNFWY